MPVVTIPYDNLIGLEPKWHPFFDRNDVNLESHQLLWADIKLSELEDGDNIFDTLTKFHQLINYTKAFDHWRKCLEYIQKCHDTYTFLVCSNLYAEDILPKLELSGKTNVWKVYIYGDVEKIHSKTHRIVDENKVSHYESIYSKHRKLAIVLENLLDTWPT